MLPVNKEIFKYNYLKFSKIKMNTKKSKIAVEKKDNSYQLPHKHIHMLKLHTMKFSRNLTSL